MSAKKKYYVVWEGREPGVYDNWEDAAEQVSEFPGARYKSYPTQAEAVAAYRGGDSRNLRAIVGLASRPPVRMDYSAFPEIDTSAWAVDASCMGNPGVMEYQAVEIASGRQLFRVGPFSKGTNNIGEYLAIVHALALMQKQGVSHTVYSDSVTAMSWVRGRGARTKLPLMPETANLHRLLRRADLWLQNNNFRTPIRKWKTEEWGEIPADFGRK